MTGPDPFDRYRAAHANAASSLIGLAIVIVIAVAVFWRLVLQ